MDAVPEIPGAEAVVEWFGRWPSFHDAEIIDVHFDRAGRSAIRIHAWLMTEGIDSDGFYVSDRHAVVTFGLEDIVDLELFGFSNQNVIFGLTVERTDRGHRLKLDPCYGLSGAIEAERVSVGLAPGKPAGGSGDGLSQRARHRP